MKWIIAGFAHETNTFSNVATGIEAFKAHTYAVGEAAVETARGTGTAMGGFIDVIEARGDVFVPTALANATPSGLVTKEAYEEIAGHIVAGAQEHRDADGILLALHGAMVVAGYDDGEGELLGRLRAVVGKDMPIVVVLDLHSHITEQMVECATVLIGFQKYPHTDIYERGAEAAGLIERLAKGEINPILAMEKPALIPPCATCHTDGGLYKELWLEALRPGRPTAIVSTSLFAGFPYADIPPLGFSVLVYADADQSAAEQEARYLCDIAWSRRGEFVYEPTSVTEAVRQALASADKPVVIPDIADNPGGGGANDSVEILRALIAQGARSTALAAIYDPEVVELGIAVGVGQRLEARLGAKTDALHGEPVEVAGIVRFVGDGRFQYTGEMTRGAWANMGACIVLDVDGILVVVCSERLQQRDPEVFRYCGIDAAAMDVLVVKSAVHFRAAFAGVAGSIVEADGAGLTALDLRLFDFGRIRRPIFPLDVM
jgi:microcystin degradation protein MlrC